MADPKSGSPTIASSRLVLPQAGIDPGPEGNRCGVRLRLTKWTIPCQERV